MFRNVKILSYLLILTVAFACAPQESANETQTEMGAALPEESAAKEPEEIQATPSEDVNDATPEPEKTPSLMHRIYSAELSLEEDPTESESAETASEKEPKPASVPVGQLDTQDGAWVVYFDKLPGKDEKPKTKIRTVTGKIDVYEVYDWAEHHEEMRGQTGHVWYRVEPDKGHWVYGTEGFEFLPTK